MLTAKQIADIIRTEVMACDAVNLVPGFEAAAEKIHDLCKPDHEIDVAAAALENEVTSTLMDMLAATCLATLIEEEGHGRSNIAYSPMSMDHMMKHYIYEVRNEGMIRHVSIKLRDDSNLRDEEEWRKPSNRHGVMQQDESPEGAKPQAEPKVHDRPIWAVRIPVSDRDRPYLRSCEDEADAKRVLRAISESHPLAVIENRHCLHIECPSTGCNQSEATST